MLAAIIVGSLTAALPARATTFELGSTSDALELAGVTGDTAVLIEELRETRPWVLGLRTGAAHRVRLSVSGLDEFSNVALAGTDLIFDREGRRGRSFVTEVVRVPLSGGTPRVIGRGRYAARTGFGTAVSVLGASDDGRPILEVRARRKSRPGRAPQLVARVVLSGATNIQLLRIQSRRWSPRALADPHFDSAEIRDGWLVAANQDGEAVHIKELAGAKVYRVDHYGTYHGLEDAYLGPSGRLLLDFESAVVLSPSAARMSESRVIKRDGGRTDWRGVFCGDRIAFSKGRLWDDFVDLTLGDVEGANATSLATHVFLADWDCRASTFLHWHRVGRTKTTEVEAIAIG